MTETELEIVVKESRELRPRTREIYLQAIQNYLEFTDRRPERWTEGSVERWVDSLLASGAMKPQTVNLQLRALRYASRRRARKERDVALDFAAKADSLRNEPPAKRRPLTVAEAQRLVRMTCGEENRPIDLRDRAILVLGLRTGVRRASMAGTTIEGLVGHKLTIPVKGAQHRTLLLDEETHDAICAWVNWLRKHDVRSGSLFRSLARQRLSGEVTIRDGMSEHGILFVIQDRTTKAGIKKIYPHAVLHTTFMEWVKDVPPEVLLDPVALENVLPVLRGKCW